MTKRARVLFLCLLAQVLLAGSVFAKSQCIICHATLGEKHQAVLRAFENDIHREKGLSCDSCHGGNPSAEDAGESMDPAAGFRGAPALKDVPQFCGRCHSDPAYMKKFNPSLPVDQETKYFTSVHGQKLKAGDTNVATCVGCHPAHSIRPARDAVSSVNPKNVPETCGRCHADKKRMAPYRIPTDQLAKYTGSVHGKALLERGDTSAPACNTCHGNHGAVPPGVENIGHVCGMCHAHNEEFFKASPMGKAWEKKKFHMCATCHNQHDIQKPTTALLDAGSSVCRKCHLASSPQMKVAAAMKEKLDSVDGAYQGAGEAIGQAEDKGMDMADAKDILGEARMSLFQAKTLVHTFRPERVAEIADKGIEAAGKARKAADKAIEDFNWRRIGLGIATLLISLLALVLYLRVREMENPHS